jgi:hypothetical protein
LLLIRCNQSECGKYWFVMGLLWLVAKGILDVTRMR